MSSQIKLLSRNRVLAASAIFVIGSLALAFQNCSAGFNALNLSSHTVKNGLAKAKNTSGSCPEIRWKFLGFKSYSEHDVALFGAGGYEFGNAAVPFLRDETLSPNFGSVFRATSYVLSSQDCGDTWTRLPETVQPIKLEGEIVKNGQDYRALNGPDHFTEDPSAAWINRGFVSRMAWSAANFSLIYPVFWETNHWAYQLALTDTPPPIIGDASSTRKDNFYSPALIVNDDSERSAMLYFGGWRREYSRAEIPVCQHYDHSTQYQREGAIVCRCDLYDKYNYAIDACTGDKIFVATNARAVNGSDNRLDYRVYQGSGLWSPNGRDSSQFESVVSSYWVNLCHDNDPSNCPFEVRSVNDPTVVKMHRSDGSLVYVMYFTTETEAKSLEVGISRTYVATSSDGLWWNNYHILRGAAGIRMPGGTPYNNSNGGVRAFPLQQRGQILLTTDMTGDDTKNADQSEKGHQFILKTSVDEPWTVTEVRAFHKRNNAGNFEEDSLSHCDPGSICDTSTIVSPAVVPAVTIARAGFFWIQNIGIFYSNGGDAFCHVPTMDVYAMMGGTSTNTYQLNSLPTEMRNDADCTVAKAKEGFFWLQNIGIFYSNGTDAFCHVTTMPNYYAMGGNSSNTVQLGSYPTAMRNDGNCQ